MTSLSLLFFVAVAYELGWTRQIARYAFDLLGMAPGISSTSEDNSIGPRLTKEGLLVVSAEQQNAIGLDTVEVKAQTEPIRIELLGTTAYDPDALTKVRSRFDALVNRVYVSLGQTVKKGEPLVDLYSAALAEAKISYEIAETQWDHDKHLLETREPLAKEGAISQQLWADTQNSEMKSRLAYLVARDKLLVYGLTTDQVDAIAAQDGTDKAQFTIRAPADGIVISRDVVPGNLYGPEDVLLTTARLDHLWVWGNVYESDLNLVRTGLSWEVQFPYEKASIAGRVDYIGDRVDPATRAVRIRGTIANPDRRFKADMLVRTLLDVPPIKGHVVIPRVAIVIADGVDYVFVRRPNGIERRVVTVAQEKADQVVIAAGLRPGEVVVNSGSLILAQAFEDLLATSPKRSED